MKMTFNAPRKIVDRPLNPAERESLSRIASETADALRIAADGAHNSAAHSITAYAGMMHLLSQVDSLAKRAPSRVAIRDELAEQLKSMQVAEKTAKSRAKRLTEQSALFLKKFGDAVPAFREAIHAGNLNFATDMMANLKDNPIVTEAAIIKFNRGISATKSFEARVMKQLADYQKANKTDPIVALCRDLFPFLSLHGYIPMDLEVDFGDEPTDTDDTSNDDAGE